jgi:hypothetical protein
LQGGRALLLLEILQGRQQVRHGIGIHS